MNDTVEGSEFIRQTEAKIYKKNLTMYRQIGALLPNILESFVGYRPCSKRSRTGSSLQRVNAPYTYVLWLGRRNKICG